MAKLLLFLLLLLLTTAINENCIVSASNQCSSCLSGLLYQNKACITTCPEGYSVSGSACSLSSSTTLFSAKFYESQSFLLNTISIFVAPTTTFIDPSRTSPLPTKERGFYFTTTSYLASNVNKVIAPDFSLRILFRVTGCASGTCKVFSVTGSRSYIQLMLTSNSLISTWGLSDNTGAISPNFVVISDFKYLAWQKFILTINQLSDRVTVTHKYISNYEYATLSSDALLQEFKGDTSIIYSFGDITNSFQGFIYDSIADNSVIQDYALSAFLIDCDYNQYYLNPQCKDCDPSCGDWPWCVRGGVCSSPTQYCYSKHCSSCSGYDYNQCTMGSTKVCWKFCSDCTSTFACTLCPDQYTLIGGLCINRPYAWDPLKPFAPTISVKFDSFDQYYAGLFQSGANSTTYAPFHNPEKNDPIPMKSRGLYFKSGAYLKAISKVSMNYINSFLIWAKPENEGFNFWNSASILLYSDATSSLLLTNSESWTRFNSYNRITPVGWTFYAFIHDFDSGQGLFSSKISINGGTSVSLYSVSGYALYDIRFETYIIGEGFLYSLNAYNIVVDPLGPYSDSACGIGNAGTCLSTCEANQYINGAGCSNCDVSCDSGCVRPNSCNLCDDINCLTCPGFYKGSCTSYPSIEGCSPGWNNYVTYNDCCSTACNLCDGPFDYNCLECADDKVLVGGFCVTECPTGYVQYGGSCVLFQEIIVDFTFNTIYDVYVDTILNVSLSTGADSSYYPTPLPSDPLPAKNRGLYFLPTSYMTSSNLTFSTTVTLAFWIKYYAPGQIFHKNSLRLSSSSSFSVKITDSSSFTSSGFPLETWTHTVVKVWNGRDKRINSLVGTLTDKITTYIGTYDFFIDYSSAFILGDPSQSFTGFLYKIQIYNCDFDVSKLNPEQVCPLMVIEGCLWDCDFNHYWDGISCKLCNSRCNLGCKQQNFCNICADSICNQCHDYVSDCDLCKNHATFRTDCQCNAKYYWEKKTETCEPCDANCVICSGPNKNQCDDCADENCLECYGHAKKSCLVCKSSFEVSFGECAACTDAQYYDPDTFGCYKCEAPCVTCRSASVCKYCMDNSHLNSLEMCECDMGYSLTTICERNYFTVAYTISNKNMVTAMFAEDLSVDLLKTDLIVNVSTCDLDFSLEKVDDSRWKIKLKLDQPATKESKLSIRVVANLVSKANSLFNDTAFNAMLFVDPGDDTGRLVQNTKTLANRLVGSTVGAALGSSILMGNPASFFYLMQALEMYYYVLIYQVVLSDALIEFLQALNPGLLLPNVFDYIIPSKYGQPVAKKLTDFGYNTNLFLSNSGINVTFIVIFALMLPVTYGLSYLPWEYLQKKMQNCLKSYKYAVFCRLLIQVYLEFILNGSIGIYYTHFGNALEIFDFLLCTVVLASIAFGVWKSIQLVIRKLKDPENPAFMKHWSTFFEEFRPEPNCQLFYLVYFSRRLVIACVILFIRHELVQLVVSIAITLAVPVYVITVKPFEEKKMNIYIVVSEFLLISYYFTLVVGILSLNALSVDSIGSACIKICIAALAVNIIFSLIELLQSMYHRICKKRVTTRVHPNEITVHTEFDRHNITAIELDRPQKNIPVNRIVEEKKTRQY